jgi:hypothetical protein
MKFGERWLGKMRFGETLFRVNVTRENMFTGNCAFGEMVRRENKYGELVHVETVRREKIIRGIVRFPIQCYNKGWDQTSFKPFKQTNVWIVWNFDNLIWQFFNLLKQNILIKTIWSSIIFIWCARKLNIREFFFKIFNTFNFFQHFQDLDCLNWFDLIPSYNRLTQSGIITLKIHWK